MLERTELVPLAKRILAHYENGTTDQTDDIVTVPVANYADPARWQVEVDRIFKRLPSCCVQRRAARSRARTRRWRRRRPGLLTDGPTTVSPFVPQHVPPPRRHVVDPGCGTARSLRLPVPRLDLRPDGLPRRHPTARTFGSGP